MAPPPAPKPGTLKAKLQNVVVGLNATVYRASGGRVGGKFGGAPILLLDHVGRKSGQARVSPLCYAIDGDDLVVVASAAGADHTPAWWLNLQAQPDTTVTVGKERRSIHAAAVSGEERDRLWKLAVGVYPDYAVYQERTARAIPVIRLSPAPAG